MTKTLKITGTGVRLDILNPTPEMVSVADICAGLAHINRFDGQSTRPVSVALHSLHVYNIVRHYSPLDQILHLQALLHDAHEYAIGDITTPAANAIAALAGGDYVAELKRRWDRAIHLAIGCPAPDTVALMTIRTADRMALNMEYQHFFDRRDWEAFGYDIEPVVFRLAGAQRDFDPDQAGAEYARILLSTCRAVKAEIGDEVAA